MKQALVISGGGSKGAFAVGVVKDLVNIYELDFEVLVGTSTGSLICPLVALGELEKLEELYTTITNEQVLIKYNIGERLSTSSVFSAQPLTDKIKALYTDDFYSRLKASGKELYFTSVCLQTEELVVFTTAAHPVTNSYYRVREIINADHFRRALLASASQPVFMPPVKVNKNIPGEAFPDYQFVDGGTREYAGVGIAGDAGGQEIFTILLSGKHVVPATGEFKNLFGVLEQTIAIFISDVGANDLYTPQQYNEGLSYIQKVKDKMKALGVSEQDIKNYFTLDGIPGRYQDKQPVKIHILQPENSLGGGPGGLVFNPAEMKAMMLQGQLVLQSYVTKLTAGEVDWA
ncbi:MAG: patatin-like phospholipase family protein [Niabella sp.]